MLAVKNKTKQYKPLPSYMLVERQSTRSPHQQRARDSPSSLARCSNEAFRRSAATAAALARPFRCPPPPPFSLQGGHFSSGPFQSSRTNNCLLRTMSSAFAPNLAPRHRRLREIQMDYLHRGVGGTAELRNTTNFYVICREILYEYQVTIEYHGIR